MQKYKNLIVSAENLLNKNLVIPEYQRAYTWGKKNISKMIEDFDEFLNSEYQHNEYYLGTILLHSEKDNDKFNIIDGQQRITTLLLMLKAINHSSFRDIVYDNPRSQYKIRENYEIISKLVDREERKNIIKNIFARIRFTVIETPNVDDAFTFFDTQNSRGVQPSVLVLLKSFNLRAISKDRFDIQKNCALTWEKIENKNEVSYLSEESEKLEWIIKIFFYRVRNWRSSNAADFGYYDNFRDQFTKAMRRSKEEEYKMYPSFRTQTIIDNNSQIITKCKSSDWFDFAIRQPIYQGEGFFKFVDYYASLLDGLMYIDIYENKKFKDLVSIHRYGSRFIGSFFSIAVLTYYDRFGEDKLKEFIKYLDVLFCNIRLQQGRILKQTMEIQFIRCDRRIVNQNILDFICGAFDSKEVIDWINKNDLYEYNTGTGIQGRFSKKHKDFWGINNV